MKNKPTFDINIDCENNFITHVNDIKFLGIYLQDSLNWSCLIEHIIPKLPTFIIFCIITSLSKLNCHLKNN